MRNISIISLVFAILWASICVKIAREKNRDEVIWALLGVFLGLIAVFILTLLNSKEFINPLDESLKIDLGDGVKNGDNQKDFYVFSDDGFYETSENIDEVKTMRKGLENFESENSKYYERQRTKEVLIVFGIILFILGAFSLLFFLG